MALHYIWIVDILTHPIDMIFFLLYGTSSEAVTFLLGLVIATLEFCYNSLLQNITYTGS